MPLAIKPQQFDSRNAAKNPTDNDDLTDAGWERRVVATRRRSGHEGTWDMFSTIRRKGDLHLITDPSAAFLRDCILEAATAHPKRMAELFTFAKDLQKEHNFDWPDLYQKVVHHYLSHGQYNTAFLWHLRLMPVFQPSLDSFAAMFTSFVCDPKADVQKVLESMYVFSPHREMYDYVVPALFGSGHSLLARDWRKKFIKYKDHPRSLKSRHFLSFVSRYFPQVPLTDEELAAIKGKPIWNTSRRNLDVEDYRQVMRRPKGIYSDSFTARWFASSWTSVDFAINLMHRVGLRELGPRSLQSIALREADALGVTERVDQIQKLGISISPAIYCRAVVLFAKAGQEELLRHLLHCDIHPDEFEDPDSRKMLLRASTGHGDGQRTHLLEEIEKLDRKTVDEPTLSVAEKLNLTLSEVLLKQGIAKVRSLVDHMAASNVSISQANSAALLERTFEEIWYHPKHSRQNIEGHPGSDPKLDRAIVMTFRVAQHDVAIPVMYWKLLIYNLGRLGRFNELEGLCLQICKLYTPDTSGLIRVHRRDLPPGLDSTVTSSDEKKLPKLPSNDRKWSESPSSFLELDGKMQKNEFMEQFWKYEMGLDDESPGIDARAQMPETPEPEEKPGNGNRNRNQFWINDCPYIPTDLPFTNRQHPMQLIFDIPLQRSILRWCFDQILAKHPTAPSLMKINHSGIEDYDIACGVRLLALLRDQGVHIDKQIVYKVTMRRVVVAQLPGRPRARSRDNRELSPLNIKRLVDEAWGSEIMPNASVVAEDLENMKAKVWNDHPKLFDKKYNLVKDGELEDMNLLKDRD